MKQETCELLKQASDKYDGELEIYESYSGRGMFGKETCGVTVLDEKEFLRIVMNVLIDMEDKDNREQFADDVYNYCKDTLGRNLIIYQVAIPQGERTMAMVEEFITTVDLEYSTLDKAIQELQELKVLYKNHTDLNLKKTSPYDYDDSEYLCLYGKRPETPKEEAERLKKEQKDKERQRKWDLEQFETLKRKLGK